MARQGEQSTLTLARLTLLVAAALAVLVTVPAAFGAKLPGGARYEGKTSDGSDVGLRLSGDSRRVARLRIHYKLSCDDGRSGKTYTVIMNARLRGKRHTFRARGSYRGSADDSRNEFSVSGRVNARGARGKFSLVNKSRANDDEPAVECTSGPLRWRASRVR